MSDKNLPPELLRLKKRLAGLYALAAAIILVGGLAYHHHHIRTVTEEAGDLLSSIRHFKTEQILFWRADRLTDTSSLLDTPVLSIFLNRLAASPSDTDLREQMRNRLRFYLKHNRYRSALLAWQDGTILLSAGEAPKKLQQETRDLLARSAASGSPEIGDFYLRDGDKPRLDVTGRAATAPGGRKLFLVLEVAPEDYLYPMILQWPTNAESGETTLSRPEGDHLLMLNDLRHAKGAPLSKRVPALDELPGVKALKGYTGVVQATDYRGVKVLASVGVIQPTGWIIVVKMDWAEILAAHGQASALILLLTFFLAASAGALIYMIFLLQEKKFSQTLSEVESERERYRFSYETLSDRANDMILLSDPQRRSLLMVNHKACQTYGYTEEEMLRLHPEDLIPPENLQAFNSRYKALESGAGMVYETVHMKKGGERFPVEVSATGVRQDGRDLVYFICRDITERKRLEAELRDRERSLAGLLYNLPGMAYRCANNPRWTMEFVSNACEALTGYKPAELLGDSAVSYSDLIVPEDRDRIWREVQTAVNAGRQFQLLYRIRRKDGQERAVWEQGKAITRPDGSVEGLEGLILDNSEKVAAQDALLASEARFQQLFSSMEEGFAIHDIVCDEAGRPVDYRWLEVNPAFERLTGLRRERILGRRAREVLPALEPDWVERFGRVALGGASDHFENYAAELKRWYEVRVFSPKRGQFAVTFLDVTERKLTAERLAASAEDWRKTFNAIDDVIWVLDKDHTILHANAATERVLGKKPAQIKGRRCWEIVHGTQKPIEGCPVVRGLASRRRERMDYTIGDRHFEVIADPILGPAGDYTGAVHVMRDVTASRKAELRMEELNRDLTKNLRLYSVLAQLSQAAAKIKERQPLFERLCGIAVASAGFRMAWIGYPDKDTGRVLPLCHAGEAGDYLAHIKISAGDGPAGGGPTGEAARTDSISVCQDIATDPRMEPWREKALKAGYASSAAVPLFNRDKLVAILNLYSAEKGFFTPDELKMLAEVQAEANLALEALTAEKQRSEAQSALERTARHLSHALEAAPVVLFTLRQAGEKLMPQWISGNTAGITGHDPAEMLTPDWFEDSLHPDDREAMRRVAAGIARTGASTDEFRLKKKTGGYAWVRATIKLSPDSPGEITGSWTDITQLKEAELRCRQLLRQCERGGEDSRP